MTKINKGIKVRAYLTKEQDEALISFANADRFVWNKMVEIFNSYDPALNPKPKYTSTKDLRDKFPFLKEEGLTSYNSQEQTRMMFLQKLGEYSNKNRKKRLGKFKFKSRKDSRISVRFSYKGFRFNKKGRLTFAVLRTPVKTSQIEELDKVKHLIKTGYFIREPDGKWYFSGSYEIDKPIPLLKTGKNIGIDVGTSTFATTDSGVKFENQKFYERRMKKLAFLQQAWSRTQPGSNRRKKLRIKIARLHKKISNSRRDHHHKLSKKLVEDFDLIGIETLDVAKMKETGKGRAISDVAWAMFFSMLKYKAEWYGKKVIPVDRYFPSTKTCSECGNKKYLGLHERSWTCDCGQEHDRDINAAINILNEALRLNGSK